MTYSQKYIGIGLISVAMLITAFAFINIAKANPSFFIRSQFSTTDLTSATSGGAFMTPGTGTTTIPSTAGFDLGVGGSQGADSAVLFLQFAGSSTAATLNYDIQYSQDGSVWYADTPNATTSPVQSLSIVQTGSFLFASSTINRSAVSNANSATSTRKIIVATPTRYVRAVLYLPSGSTNGTAWGEFIAKRQAP